MAKRQIKPKSFTDEEGEWKALIGKNIFLFFLQQMTKAVVKLCKFCWVFMIWFFKNIFENFW